MQLAKPLDIPTLESQVLVRNLPEQLIVFTNDQRDEDLAKYPDQFWESLTEEEQTKLRRVYSNLSYGFVMILSAFFGVVAWIGWAVNLILNQKQFSLIIIPILLTLAFGLFFKLLEWNNYFARKARNSALQPGLEEIRLRYESQVNQLFSDPVFFLEKARTFFYNEKNTAGYNLDAIKKDFAKDVTEPLTRYTERLAEWKGARRKIEKSQEKDLPGRSALLREAIHNVNKYQKIVDEMEIQRKEKQGKIVKVEKEIKSLQSGIDLITSLHTEFSGYQRIFKMFREEAGSEEFSEETLVMHQKAMARIDTSLDGLMKNISVIKTTIAGLTQALPEAEQQSITRPTLLAA